MPWIRLVSVSVALVRLLDNKRSRWFTYSCIYTDTFYTQIIPTSTGAEREIYILTDIQFLLILWLGMMFEVRKAESADWRPRQYCVMQ